MTSLEGRLAGAIWGHLIGDALGVPYEFRPAVEIGSVRFGAAGQHAQPPGTWSDDGALMLALLDSLLSVGFDVSDQGRRALDWYRRGAYTPDADGLFDIGRTTQRALNAMERGVAADRAGPSDEGSSGNGSLMRILPLALVERDVADARLVHDAELASRVTHGHEGPQVACALYSIVVRRLLSGVVGRRIALVDSQQTLRSIYELAESQREHLRALDYLEGWPAREGRGTSWDCFWSAWDAFAGASTYEETIERAVRYGNDTDTTAAVAGGLAGTYWGVGSIPGPWLSGMRGKDVVEPLVSRLVQSHWRSDL